MKARFPFFFNSNGSVNFNSPNGGVEDLFTVSGRSDAGSCNIPQPSFSPRSAKKAISSFEFLRPRLAQV